MRLKNVIVIVSALVSLFALSNCLLLQNNTCPDQLTVLPNFDMNQYQGLWYEVRKINFMFNANAHCNRARFTVIDRNAFLANFTGLIRPLNNRPYVVLATLTALNPQQPNTFLAEDLNNGLLSTNNNFIVLDTDYVSYSVNYYCTGSKDENFWIYSRSPVLSQESINRINQRLTPYSSILGVLSTSDQENCPNIP